MRAKPTDPDLGDFLHGVRLQLSRLALVLTGDREHADDLVQDTFVKVIRNWASVQRSSDPVAYSCRIMINQWRDDGRRRRTRRDLEKHLLEPQIDQSLPHDRIVDRITLQDAMARLTAKQRAVLYFRFYENLSVREVAERMGCSEGTVKSQTNYALRALSNSPFVTSSWER